MKKLLRKIISIVTKSNRVLDREMGITEIMLIFVIIAMSIIMYFKDDKISELDNRVKLLTMKNQFYIKCIEDIEKRIKINTRPLTK